MSQEMHEGFLRLCQALGEDLDSPVCRRLQKHIAECPQCRIVFDTVRQTIRLYRAADQPSSVPGDVEERLFRVLKLDGSHPS
jgi:predicted anti-sigma-YlaC factor YlaD